MKLKALHVGRILDIGSVDGEPFLALSLRPGQIVNIKDSFRVLKNIESAINAGFLQVLSYDSSYDSPVTQQEISTKANESDLARVAFSGKYDDLTEKPTSITISNESYSESSWDNNLDGATKNVIRDELESIRGNIEFLKLSDITELTIDAGGSITVTGSLHTVDGAGDLDDYLVTINGGSEGSLVFIRPENSSRTIWLDHAAGNILTPTGSDYRLPYDTWTGLVFDGNNFQVAAQPQTIHWEDLRVPVTSTRVGGTKDPAFTVFKTNGLGSQGVFLYWFNQTNEEELYFAAQLPHAWKTGTAIHSHVHWIPASNGTAGQKVCWGLEYTWSDIGSIYGNTTIISGNSHFPADNSLVAGKHYVTEIGEISGAGISDVSSMLICRIFRDAGGTLNTDDYNDLTGLMEIDFHYERDSDGSREEYIKY